MDAPVALAHLGRAQHGKEILPSAPLRIIGDTGLRVIDVEPCPDEPGLVLDEVLVRVLEFIQEVETGSRCHLERRDHCLTIAVAGNLRHRSPPRPWVRRPSVFLKATNLTRNAGMKRNTRQLGFPGVRPAAASLCERILKIRNQVFCIFQPHGQTENSFPGIALVGDELLVPEAEGSLHKRAGFHPENQ